MKIAVIGAKNIPAKQGVIERYCQELYPQLAIRGHKVDLFIQPSHHYPCLSINYYRQIKVISLLSIPGKKLNFLLNTAINTVWATFCNYDVIHIHGVAAAWFSWFPQLFSSSPVVVTCHQLDFRKHKWHRLFHWLLPRLEKAAICNADELIVTSRALSNYFRQKYNVNPHFIANAPASYNLSNSDYSLKQALGIKNQEYILYLGKFEPEQRLDLLIEAFQKLQPHNWRLVLSGEIGYAPEYASKFISIAQQQDNIIVTSEMRGNSLAELVRGASILVNPSEGTDLDLSMNMLEAMREGTPVLASDTIVHRKLLDGGRGLLFKAQQPDSLLRQLEYVMSKPNLLLAMVKKAQTYIAVHHNWDRVTYKNLFLYLQLTAEISTQPSIQPAPRTFDEQPYVAKELMPHLGVYPQMEAKKHASRHS